MRSHVVKFSYNQKNNSERVLIGKKIWAFYII